MIVSAHGREGNVPETNRPLHPRHRRTDLFAAAVVQWEVLTHRRLFHGGDSGAIVKRILDLRIEPPSHMAPDLPHAIDDVVMRGLARDIDQRFETAAEMADALEAALAPATARTIGLYVERVAEQPLAKRRDALRRFEASSLEVAAPSEPRSPARGKRSVTLAVLGGCAASALVAGGLVAWLGHTTEPNAVVNAVSSPDASDSPLAAGRAASPGAVPNLATEPSGDAGAGTVAHGAVDAVETPSPAAPSPVLASTGRRPRAPAAPAKAGSSPPGSALPLYGRR